MADIAALAFLLILICAGSFLYTGVVNNRRRKLAAQQRIWTVEQHSRPEGVVIQLECPGELPIPIGQPIRMNSRSADYAIEERRAEADFRCESMNARLTLQHKN